MLLIMMELVRADEGIYIVVFPLSANTFTALFRPTPGLQRSIQSSIMA